MIQSSKITKDATTIILVSSDNKILLQKRDDNPLIEYPSHLGLIAGYIEENETPIEAIIREIKEEIKHKSKKTLNISSISYLGSIQRFDFNRYDYVHFAFISEPTEDLFLTEGCGIEFLHLDECINHKTIAPHHRYYLQRFSNDIKKMEYALLKNSHYTNFDLKSLVEVTTLNKGKDLSKLENGSGFVEGEGDDFSCLVHTEEDVKFIGNLRFIPNKSRGNHYHLRKVEYMLLLNGEMKCELRYYKDESLTFDLNWKVGEVLKIMPGAIHTITAISNETVMAVEYSPQRFMSKDVFKLG